MSNHTHEPLNGIKATIFHDQGAVAQCFYCHRYTLDTRALGANAHVCKCGKTHGWSGSFVKPGPNAQWSGHSPQHGASVANPAWREINTLNLTDDLVWLRKGDSVDGPKVADADDYDLFTEWAPVNPPSFNISAASVASPVSAGGAVAKENSGTGIRQIQPRSLAAPVSDLEKIGYAISQALQTCPTPDVLSVITGSFVGLTLELVRRSGNDVNKEIKVDGGKQRDVTIHAPKEDQTS